MVNLVFYSAIKVCLNVPTEPLYLGIR